MSKKDPKFFGIDDCDRPACDDMVSMMNASAAAAASKPVRETEKKVECPLGTAELGRSSWGLLHSMVRQTNERTSESINQSRDRFPCS